MKKKMMAVLMLLCATAIVTGCGKNNITIADLKDVEAEKYVTLPDYKNLQVEQPEKVEITDAYVKSYINNRVNAVSDLHELTGTVENGDVVNIDYAGTIDGTAFQGGTAQGQLLEIGSGSFIDGFEDGLIGANVGETKQLSLKFPDNYRSADVAGKDCIFAVKINYILSELTDENVNLVDPGYQSVETYWEDAKNNLIEFTEYQYERTLKTSIASNLIAGSTYQEIPESLIEDYKSSLRTDFENEAERAGMSLEEYMENAYYTSADSIDEEIGTIAEWCAKEGLALQAIAGKEGISVSDEEVDAAIAEYTAAVGDAGEELEKENVRENLLHEKVYDFLTDIYKA